MLSETRVQFKLLLAFLSVVSITGVLSACGGPSDESHSATLEALALSIASTATAAAGGEVDPADALKTVEAEATTQAWSVSATQAALSELSAEQQAATTTAFAPYAAELPKYDVDPSRGRPGWIHPPATLDIEGYQQYDSKNQFIFTIVRDFALSADITWNTQYGTSGCGFILRSDGDEEKPSQYMVMITRGGLGHVIFAPLVEGEMVGAYDFYAKGKDPNFDWLNDTTNRLTVVGREMMFTIYTNDVLIGEIDTSEPPPDPIFPPPPERPSDASDEEAMARYQQALEEYEREVEQVRANLLARRNEMREKDTVFERGFVAMLAISESGHTVCRFDNAWLWLIEDVE
jgi:hypothetical protein